MKTNSKIALLALIMGLCSLQLKAQEILTGFHAEREASAAKNGNEAVLTLPFFDDFSKAGIYPDPAKWTDRDVLVNDGFPMMPPTRKAATFDVLDANGRVYDYAISNPFVAEYLTSARIRLDSVFAPVAKALSPADSLYFSFYYQPQGYGNKPEDGDSLVLQFGNTTPRQEFQYIEYNQVSIQEIFDIMPVDTLFPHDTVWAFGDCDHNLFAIITDTITPIAQGSIAIPCDSVFVTVYDTTWYHVWSTPGRSLEQFVVENDGAYFQQVMIPITNPRYFRSDFYFRFYNYASIVSSSQPSGRGNEDNWNIDVVYLDLNRNYYDGSYPMLAFSGKAPNFLKRYQSMPYRQYRVTNTSALNESLALDIANLDKEAHEMHYHYTVTQVGGNQHYRHDVDPVIIEPFNEWGYLPCDWEYENPACPFVGQAFSIDYLRDTTSYIVRHYIYDSTCYPPLIDSLVYKQGFYNYFAYDDGIPELGYGVEPASGSFAVKYELATYDTLCGVQLLFNHTLNDANDKYFDIVVWKDENGHPGAEIYRKTNLRPKWEEQPYKFSYYTFDKPVMLSGIFYIGIMQQSGGIINIGFDSSFDNSQYNFINVNGAWQNSQFPGSLMIRPVVGASYYIGVEEQDAQSIRLFPNPASSVLNIQGVEAADIAEVNVYDLMGRRLSHTAYSSQIAIADFSEGLYLLQVTTTTGTQFTQKFMIQK